jgi:hypothetical protein
MSQVKLNPDIFYEIFSYFVAIDPDGPFTLILVCIAWRDMVRNKPLLWSWIDLDDEIGDMKTRAAICTTLSASHPLNLILHLPISPSLVQIIRSYVDRVRSVFVYCPTRMKMDTAAVHVSNLIRELKLHHTLFRFIRGGKDTPYCPADIYRIIEMHSRNQSMNSPTCPSNMITALILDDDIHQFSLHTLLTWLSSNVHLMHMEINFNRLHMESIRCATMNLRI